MRFELTNNPIENISADEIIVFTLEDKKSYIAGALLKKLDKKLDGTISEILKKEQFKAKFGDRITFYPNKKIVASKIIVFGLGKKDEFDKNILRKACVQITKSRSKTTNSIAVALEPENELKISENDQMQGLAQGLLLGNYKFNAYRKKDEDEKELDTVIVSYENKKDLNGLEAVIKESEILYDAIVLARNLVNEQASVATPEHLAQIALDISKKDKNITCKIFGKKELEKIGMGAFLGIAQGAEIPRFIHLEYTPAGYKGKETIAIVGKGITFDTGGVSLKPSQYMTTMKLDMAGGASVLGIFSIISFIKPKVKIMGLIAATPNVVSAKSIVPGDIVRAMNGKTIEILNTDAEGRVTLADSLSYAVKNKATKIIDLATLTGAAEVALGTDFAALYSNNKELKEQLLAAAKESGEKVWEMPLVKEYKELNKSDVADISNLASTPYGGSITAALFLEEFVDSLPWVHFDIAGPAFSEKEGELGPKGGTGFGVAMLYNYLKSL